MKKAIIGITILVIGIAIVVLARGFYFYRYIYVPSPGAKLAYEFSVPPPALTAGFTDSYEKGEGIILIDQAHSNDFEKDELNVLTLRLISRGLTVRYLTDKNELEKELLGVSKEERTPAVRRSAEVEAPPASKEALPKADAFIVVAPRSAFSDEEVKITDNFTSQGGRLLLIADPTRRSNINSLALKYGLIFEPDYLYNMKENDLNYRNIFITDFEAANRITRNLKKIALYTAGSISSANSSIAFVSDNTLSSIIETRKRLSPLALAQDSKTLAIYDLTFMTEPYNGILDNNQLISNVADWLMPSKKK